MKKAAISILIFIATINLYALGKRPCIDPISTINWGYFFDDLLIGKYKKGDNNPLCFCSRTSDGIPDAGLKLRITEPIAFLEFTSTPFKFPCFQKDSGRGGIARIKKRGTPQKYRNAHYIQYPVFALLNFATDQICVSKKGRIALPFLGELLPNWYDDFTAAMLQPWSLLFSNPIAQTACLWDCATSTFHKPEEYLSWCNGCWQSKRINTGRPLKGNPPESDAALANSLINWQHLGYSLPQTVGVSTTTIPGANAPIRSESDIACGKTTNYFPLMIKNQYKFQIAYPTSPDTIITPGESGIRWTNFKQVPTYQDRIFVLWRRKICCMGIAHLILK